MGVLSEEYIMQRLRAYVNSEAGRVKIAQHRKDVFYGKVRTGAGNLTKANIEAILQEVRNDFVNTISTVIASFRGDGVLTAHGEMDERGYIQANISVDEDALRRESLHYMNKNLSIGHGEGVDDILALFTHGYTLNKRPYGFWVRDTAHASTTGQAMERIGARMHRDPNPFLTEFVNRMNEKYGDKCVVTLNDKYTIEGGG